MQWLTSNGLLSKGDWSKGLPVCCHWPCGDFLLRPAAPAQPPCPPTPALPPHPLAQPPRPPAAALRPHPLAQPPRPPAAALLSQNPAQPPCAPTDALLPTLLRSRSALLLLDSPIVPRRLLLDMLHPLVHPLPERHSVLLRTLRPTWMFSCALGVVLNRLIARARVGARFQARALLLVCIVARAAHPVLSLPRCILLDLLLLLVAVLNHDAWRPLASSLVFGTPSHSYSLRRLVHPFPNLV
ncbi:unnamed protein product [Closterium sp. NIES-54]